MKAYLKPMVLELEDIAEGIYAASGEVINTSMIRFIMRHPVVMVIRFTGVRLQVIVKKVLLKVS